MDDDTFDDTSGARIIEIAPSVLPADFSRFGEECLALEKAGVDRIHFDVMDGRFVPNLTFGPDVIASVRPLISVPFEAHLMVEEPDRLAHLYVEAGCERLIVHAEACRHLHRVLGAIADLGATPAVTINPATPVSAVEHVLDLVDMVLIMTVNPGFGGQSYLAGMEPKVSELARIIDERDLDVDIEVDGGIGPATIQAAATAGANVFVAGSALFRDPDGLEHAVAELRELAEATQGLRVSEPTSDNPPKPAMSDRRRLLLRIAAGVVATALVITLGVLVLGGKDTPRSTEAYCSRMSDTRDLGEVLGTGDATQIEDAVRQLQAAGKVAPAEIQPAMDQYVAYATALSRAVASSDKDEASIVAALKAAAIAQNAQADQVAAAVTQVETYVTATCGFSLSPDTTSG